MWSQEAKRCAIAMETPTACGPCFPSGVRRSLRRRRAGALRTREMTSDDLPNGNQRQDFVPDHAWPDGSEWLTLHTRWGG